MNERDEGARNEDDDTDVVEAVPPDGDLYAGRCELEDREEEGESAPFPSDKGECGKRRRSLSRGTRESGRSSTTERESRRTQADARGEEKGGETDGIAPFNAWLSGRRERVGDPPYRRSPALSPRRDSVDVEV